MEIIFSPSAVDVKTSSLQYARPQRRPIPRNPLSSPSFLSEFAISARVFSKSAAQIPVALSSMLMVRLSVSSHISIRPLSSMS